jgi:hypothetical protein
MLRYWLIQRSLDCVDGGTSRRLQCAWMRIPVYRQVAFLLLCAVMARSNVRAEVVELIKDGHFQNGFILWEPKPGQHIPYGELPGFKADAKPVWGLSQWSSRFPLDATPKIKGDGVLTCSNAAKAITTRLKGKAGHLSMAVNTAAEYGVHARKAGDPWVHLLVEQEFHPLVSLEEISAAILHVEARLSRSHNLHQAGDYSPDLHAAQFQLYFTIQNRNRESAGFGDLVWFGIPIYDNRDRLTKEFKAQDFGGTAKFIFMPAGATFSKESAHDGKWIVIEKDLLPLMREALQTAWDRGFLKNSKKRADYCIGGMNMGWELPGTFDVEMQIRNLSLKVSPNDRAN